MIAGAHFGDYQAGYRFGRLGYELIERRGLKRFQGNLRPLDVLPWTRHVKTGRDLVHGAFALSDAYRRSYFRGVQQRPS